MPSRNDIARARRVLRHSSSDFTPPGKRTRIRGKRYTTAIQFVCLRRGVVHGRQRCAPPHWYTAVCHVKCNRTIREPILEKPSPAASNIRSLTEKSPRKGDEVMATHVTMFERGRSGGITEMHLSGATLREIAATFGRTKSTVSRELRHNRSRRNSGTSNGTCRRRHRPLKRSMDDWAIL